MLNHIEISARIAEERRRDDRAAAARERRAAAFDFDVALPLARRAARPMGHLLFKLGLWLLRYGKVERAPQHPSAGAARLN